MWMHLIWESQFISAINRIFLYSASEGTTSYKRSSSHSESVEKASHLNEHGAFGVI